ncbi:MAG TPA: bifunctional adenosylcobinamide kinase/adenosylcobinamide-phosphate guanylyltransferase [Solirubrobacterales bacterium]|nr:bifunctional adenosylcobinamide kinase/adenosylcobinamide-phosphate guanylyltransferase [Solirubrobacterales bacterium]
MPLTLLLGGARSGKSSLAVARARALAVPVVFLATAEALDAEMEERVSRHRVERDPAWVTVEEPLDLERALAAVPAEGCAIVDCLSLWVANLVQQDLGEEEVVGRSRRAAEAAGSRPGATIAVSNEVGMGVVPEFELGRRYRDALGRVNAAWAAAADEALLVVAGRTLELGAAR